MSNFKTAKEINDIVHEKMPQIIECFVEVYGEAYRERITNRLNNTLCIFIEPSSGMTESDENNYYESLEDLILENSDIIYIRENFNEISFISFFGAVGGGAFTSVRKNDFLAKPVSVCFFRNLEKLYDKTFFHELNHVIMSDVVFNSQYMAVRLGIKTNKFQKIDEDSYKSIYDNDEEKRRALNEVYTDYLAMKVYEVAKKQGFELGEGKATNSAYSCAFELLEELFEDNSEILADCFLNGNINRLLDQIGAENFDKLLEVTDKAIHEEQDYKNHRIKAEAFDGLKQIVDEVCNSIAKKKNEEDIDYILD